MIEILQLLLRLGTFQLSDIFYNTVGGVLGGMCYWGIIKSKRSVKEKLHGVLGEVKRYVWLYMGQTL